MTDRAIYQRLDQIQARLRRLEEAVAAIATAAGVSLPTPPTASEDDPVIVDLLRQGRRVDAVKAAVDRLGLSLVDATDYVGRVEGGL